jgi:hypothetical protein
LVPGTGFEAQLTGIGRGSANTGCNILVVFSHRLEYFLLRAFSEIMAVFNNPGSVCSGRVFSGRRVLIPFRPE